MRFSIGLGMAVLGRLSAFTPRGIGGDGGNSDATVMEEAMFSSLSLDEETSPGESGAPYFVRRLRTDRRSEVSGSSKTAALLAWGS